MFKQFKVFCFLSCIREQLRDKYLMEAVEAAAIKIQCYAALLGRVNRMQKKSGTLHPAACQAAQLTQRHFVSHPLHNSSCWKKTQHSKNKTLSTTKHECQHQMIPVNKRCGFSQLLNPLLIISGVKCSNCPVGLIKKWFFAAGRKTDLWLTPHTRSRLHLSFYMF